MMKIILAGYPGSQRIVPASKYLTRKYLKGFDITYLNYKGGISGWSAYISGYLEALTDSYIIFALDDYLVSEPIDAEKFDDVTIGGKVVCVKLCESTPEEHIEYPVTTQYCVWNRKYLISLLERVKTPWEFEIEGSKLIRTDGYVSIHFPCIPYFANSSISSRWEGVRLDGLNEEDKKYILDNGLIS